MKKNTPMNFDTIINRFNDNLDKTNTCWNWNGWKNKKYGVFKINGKAIKAHRFSYAINKGRIPKGMLILHKCNNPSCVNPDHLYLGTQKQNVLDSVRAGTHNMCRHVRFTENQIIDMRKMYKSGYSQYEIADMFKTKQGYISDVIRRKIWRHI